jgi:hypothetical protein
MGFMFGTGAEAGAAWWEEQQRQVTGTSTSYLSHNVSNPVSSTKTLNKATGVWSIKTAGGNYSTRNIPIDPRLVAGPGSYAAEKVKQNIEDRNQRIYQNTSYAQRIKNITIDPYNPIATHQRAVAEMKANMRSYYFEGQPSQNNKIAQVTLSRQAGDENLMTGNMSLETVNQLKNYDPQKTHSQLSNLPPNYYLGFGNTIKAAAGGISQQNDYSKMLTRFMHHGQLGDLGRDTVAGQTATAMKGILAWIEHQKGIWTQMHTAKEHMQPDTNGEYQLGNMQGQRQRAWDRRQLAKQEELKKKKLVRVETDVHLQNEAKTPEMSNRVY